MQFVVKRDNLLRSLNFVQGVVEKKNTLPILSNVLLQLKDKKLLIVATDLDIIFYDEILDVKIINEGSTTTSAAILYDILRKISSNSELKFDLKSENKLSLKSENADFNLLCLPTDNFPSFADKFDSDEISINNGKFLKLLNKTKISISNDDTRHYLNGIFIHLTEGNGRSFLTGVATDSHRLSSSSIELNNQENFTPFILPKKTVFQLCSLLAENTEQFATYFETRHAQTAQQLCEMFNFGYSRANDGESLAKQLAHFYQNSDRPKLLEIFTPVELNDKVLLGYFEYLRKR